MKNFVCRYWYTRNGIGLDIPELGAYNELWGTEGDLEARARDLVVLHCEKDTYLPWNSTTTFVFCEEPPKGFTR